MQNQPKRVSLLRKDICNILNDFEDLLQIACFYCDGKGNQLGAYGFPERSNFCRFISNFDGENVCRQSYMQSHIQAMHAKTPQIYFCPFGLVNITIPVFLPDKTCDFITAGPFIFTPPDDLLIKNILDLNVRLRPKARELRLRLGEINVKSEGQAQSLFTIIWYALQGLMGTNETASLSVPGEQTNTVDAQYLLSTLEQKIAADPCRQWQQKCYRLRKEFELLSQNVVENLSKKTLESLITNFMEQLYEGNVFYQIHGRALQYIAVLLKLTLAENINPNMIFSLDCKEIFNVMEADNLAALSTSLYAINDRFIECYLPGKSLANKGLLFQIMYYIRAHYDSISLQDVAEEVGLSPAYLSNLFKKETGRSYSSYLNKVRIEESKRLLRQQYSLADIAQRVGFSDQSYYSNVFRKYEGISPHKWRQLYSD